MEERIKKLREASQGAVPHITSERAALITKFYKTTPKASAPVTRALAFKFLLENKKVEIFDGELIVGERGPEPRATPTYPEIVLHSIKDLEILDSRKKIPYKVDEKTKDIYRTEIIPLWTGKAMRDRIFAAMDSKWKNAYDAGVFTEFMEQRAPGHTVLDNKIFKKGLLDLKQEIKDNLNNLGNPTDPTLKKKVEELKAMDIAADALIAFAKRYAEKAKELATIEKNPERKLELEKIAEACTNVPAFAPKTFWEALQYYWFVHIGVITEVNPWDAFNPGRLDQHLYPFFKAEIDAGTLTKEKAKELLEAFWIKFNNQPAPPKVGVTAEESATYTDFALINVGGLKRDGTDGVNELSFMILDVIEEMRLLQPSSMVQISNKTPDEFLKRALNIIKTGYGQPSVFNTDEIILEMVRQGKSLEDAREGGASGCVETGAFGKECYILTGYFNMPKILEITLHNGFDPRTGKMVGIGTGDARDFKSYEELFSAFQQQLRHFIDIKIKGNLIIEKLYAEHLPVPFLSLLIDDCIKNGKDYHEGGARYNTSYIQGVGLGTATDALTAIKYNVFDKEKLPMRDMLDAMAKNFDGNETLRQWLVNRTPKYGNDNDYADNIMKMIFQTFFEAVDGRPNAKGGCHRINLLPTTVHVYFGKVTGALPDGRKANEPLSEGISPVQGGDRNGPTAVVKSVSKFNHTLTGGTLLNQKFTPQLLSDETGIEKLAMLIRAHFKLMSHHIQFNVITTDTLKEAQKHPEKYRDLIVRVAGYSDYFVNIGEDLQNEIIKRTEQGSF